MAAWRRQAIELLLEHRRELAARDSSIYSVFFDLKPRLREAHDAGDDELLRRIYGYAEWCARQTAETLWNAAGVAFYEHLFDYPAYSLRVVPWLSPWVVYAHWNLWQLMVNPAEWARVAPLLETKRTAGEQERRRHRRISGE